MKPREIKALLTLDEGGEIRRNWRCPDENDLAAYVKGRLPPGKRKKIEAHVSDCKACIQSMALLARTFEDDQVPLQLMARARALASEKQSSWWRWEWALAAATACFLITVSVVIWRAGAQRNPTVSGEMVAQQQPSIQQPPVEKTTTATHIVRPALPLKPELPRRIIRGENNQSGPALIAPREGGTIGSTSPTLRWQFVPGATFYEVRVVTPDGTPVLNEHSNATQITLNAQSLQPGKYFVTVIAHFGEGRTLKSTSSFRVAF